MSGATCGACYKQVLDISEICFYEKSAKELHLIVRQEIVRGLRSQKRLIIDEANTKRKMTPVLCPHCSTKIGTMSPYGPESVSFIALSLRKLSVAGMRLLEEKEKLVAVKSKTPRWDNITTRNDMNFFGSVDTLAVAVSSAPPKHSNRVPVVRASQQDLMTYSWDDLVVTPPRDYQIQAFAQLMHSRSLILSLPTGLGKTLVGAMALCKMKKMNPSRVGLFLVDKIPLVFQQGEVILRETGLRICLLCSETASQRMVDGIINGKFDVVVATAGCLVEKLSKSNLTINNTCCVIIDECHHARNDHPFHLLLKQVHSLPAADKPLILGLTASPVSGGLSAYKVGSPPSPAMQIAELERNFGGFVLHPSVPKNVVKESWFVISMNEIQIQFVKCLLSSIKLYRDSLVRKSTKSTEQIPDVEQDVEQFLLPRNIAIFKSRIGSLKSPQRICLDPETLRTITKYVDTILDLCSLTDVVQVIGIDCASRALISIASRVNRSGDPGDIFSSFPQFCWAKIDVLATKVPSKYENHVSDRIVKAERTLTECKGDCRVLILVESRLVARETVKRLRSSQAITERYNPEMVVGHSGFDGMQWFDEQEASVNRFRTGATKLLVATNVLEEGIDVPQCDFVIRLQPPKSLRSHIQSRGRARQANSQIHCYVTHYQQLRQQRLDAKERELESIVSVRAITHPTSPEVLQTIQYIQNGRVAPRARVAELCADKHLSLMLWYIYPVERHFQEIDFESELLDSLDQSGLNHLVVSRITDMPVDTFPVLPAGSATGHLVSLTSSFTEQHADERDLFSNWSFKTSSGGSIWATMQTRKKFQKGMPFIFKSYKVTVLTGEWSELGVFTSEKTLADDSWVSFIKTGMHIGISDLWMELAPMVIHPFIAVSWESEKECNILLPLNSTPPVFGMDMLGNITRCTVKHNGVSQSVLCLHMHNCPPPSELTVLLSSSFGVPVYNVRVKVVFEAVKTYPPHSNHLIEWLIQALHSQRLGCSTRAAELKLRLLISEMECEESIIQALTEMQSSLEYWTPICDLFKKAYEAANLAVKLDYTDNLIKRAMLTPTQCVYLTPLAVADSRLYRRFGIHPFVTVVFRDEQRQRLNSIVTLNYVKQSISDTQCFAGKEYIFFAASSSQLREQQAVYVDIEFLPGACSGQSIAERLARFRGQIVDPSGSASIAKYLSRLALYMTSDIPTIKIDDSCTVMIKDVHCRNGSSVLTDGAGKIAITTAKSVAAMLGLHITPSAFQIRWRGVKGVLVTVPDTDADLSGKKIAIRPSMKKFQMPEENVDNTLCIVRHAKWSPCHLNREIISLLTSQQDQFFPHKALESNLISCLNTLSTIFEDATEMKAAVFPNLPPDFAAEYEAYLSGVEASGDIFADPLVLDLCRVSYRVCTRDLTKKARIPIKQGCHLLGIPDPTGTLLDGEIFVQLGEDSPAGKEEILSQEQVIVWRNPCLHPGDVRVVTAVDCPALREYKNVVIFPCNNNTLYNIPESCSGGDLDGDQFYVVWDQEITLPKELEDTPLPYGTLGANAPRPEQYKIKEIRNCWEIADFVHSVYSNDSLGRISNMHQAISDQFVDGARNPLAIEVARAQSFAVDYPKTGIPPSVPEEAFTRIKKYGHPDFMEKTTDGYVSNKILGTLYRTAKSYDFQYTGAPNWIGQQLVCRALCPEGSKLPQQNSLSEPENELLEALKGTKSCLSYETEALNDYRVYCSGMRQIMTSYGLRSEAECLLSTAISWHPLIKNIFKAREVIRRRVCQLQTFTKQRFAVMYTTPPEQEIAARWWYQVSQSDGFAKSFGLLHGRILLGVLRQSGAINTTLGKKNSHKQLGDAILSYGRRHMQETKAISERKMRYVSLVEDTINSLIDSEQHIQLKVFGSVAQDLCSLYSDIDVVAIIPSGCMLFKSGHESMATLRDKQIWALEIVSRLLGNIAVKKIEVFKANVPIIRFSIIPPDGLGEEWFDLTVDVSSFLKTLCLKTYFLQHQWTHSVFLFIQHWARTIGVIRQDAGITNDGGRHILSTGELHVLILNSLLAEDKGHIYNLIPSEDPADMAGAAVLRFFKSTSCSSTAKKYSFLIGTAAIETSFNYRYLFSPSTVSSICSVETINLLAHDSRIAQHCLLATGCPEQLLSSQDDDEIVCKLCLPSRISGSVGSALAFHEERLSRLSGAVVELEETGSKLIMVATGNRRSIMLVQREISSHIRELNWSCRSRIRSSRYHLEGSVGIVAWGSEGDDLQLRLKAEQENNRQRIEMSSCQPIKEIIFKNIGCDDVTVRNALAECIARQIPKLPSLSTFAFYDCTVSFGTFLIMSASDSLPDTSQSLSISELHQRMESMGRNRKAWERRKFQAAPKEKEYVMKKMEISSGQAPVKGKKKKAKRGLRSTFRHIARAGNQELDVIQGEIERKLEDAGFGLLARCQMGADGAIIENKTEAYMMSKLRDSQKGSAVDSVDLYGKLSAVVSRSFEIGIRTVTSTRNEEIVTSIAERQLSWVSTTILGGGIIPDMRFRFETFDFVTPQIVQSAKEKMPTSAVGGAAPISFKFSSRQGSALPIAELSFNPMLTQEAKGSIYYVRKRIYASEFGCDDEIGARARLVRVLEWHQNIDSSGGHNTTALTGPEEALEFQLRIPCQKILEAPCYNKLAADILRVAFRAGIASGTAFCKS